MSSMLGNSRRDNLLFVIMFSIIVAALLFPSFQLTRLQDFIIRQNDKIIENSDRNYLAVVNQTKAGNIRAAHIAEAINSTQSVDDRILQQLAATNELNNKTASKFGGTAGLINDIHNTRVEMSSLTKLLKSNAAIINQTSTRGQGEQNHALLVKILTILNGEIGSRNNNSSNITNKTR